jgi:hypothetical protein
VIFLIKNLFELKMKDRNLTKENQPKKDALNFDEQAKKRVSNKKKYSNKKYWIDQSEDESVNDEDLIDFLKFEEEEE